MDNKFDEYIDETTNKIINLLCSNELDEEEKGSLVDHIINDLIESAGSAERMINYDCVSDKSKIVYFDRAITYALEKEDLPIDECIKAISICRKQCLLLKEYGVYIDEVENRKPNECEGIFQGKLERIRLVNKIVALDKRISELSIDLHTLSPSQCNQLINCIETLEELRSDFPKTMGEFPTIVNTDNAELKKKLINRLNQ